MEKESKKQPTNRNHKDRLFRLVFQEKRYQLELYNALNGTNYTDPDVLEETTLEDAIFLGVKNDLSFIIGMSLNMYEHQSSKNLNMPLRGLIYFSQVYQHMCEVMAIISMRNRRFHCLFQTILFSTMG